MKIICLRVNSEVLICGSGSASKCHGSPTMVRPILGTVKLSIWECKRGRVTEVAWGGGGGGVG
jgi:hypothetical protein